MKFSIVVYTCCRSDMLRSALHSIALQTRTDLIKEVIVSENGGDLKSKDVCLEFPQLPITYLNQSPQLDILKHFTKVVALASEEWIAWLADDDMWSRFHLEEAARLLSLVPNASAFVGQAVTIYDEARSPVEGFRHTIHSCSLEAKGGFRDHYVLAREQMLPEVLFQTPVNMWAMVIRKESMLSALRGMDGMPGYDSDRWFIWRVCTTGPIVVGCEVSLFYRVHSNSATNQMIQADKEKHKDSMREYTRLILNDAESLGVNARDVWRASWLALDVSVRERLSTIAGRVCLRELARIWGDELVGDLNRHLKVQETGVKRVIRMSLPPVIIRVYQRLRLWLKSCYRK